jgi:hypothetical protein
VFLYGHRPSTPSIWYLSPYEFMIYWKVELATYSLNTLRQEPGGVPRDFDGGRPGKVAAASRK